MIPAGSPRDPVEYDAARRGAGLVDRSGYGRIAVSGKDRAAYLHGLLTNDITALQPGQGCYAAYLTAQGRMITDLFVYELGDVILLSVPQEVKDALMARLDQFIFSEDVQLGDVTETFVSVALVGPNAAHLVSNALDAEVTAIAALPEHGNVRTSFKGEPAIVVRITDLGEPGYELLVERTAAGAMIETVRSAGAVDIGTATAEALRLEGGVPKFHRDMDETTIPLEAGIESRAISLTKGCYVGQEVIIRVLHRGHGRVARKLVGLRFSGRAVPDVAATIQGDARDIGEITSATWSPALECPIALGYVHRDFIEPGSTVSVNGESAVVTALPFVARHP